MTQDTIPPISISLKLTEEELLSIAAGLQRYLHSECRMHGMLDEDIGGEARLAHIKNLISLKYRIDGALTFCNNLGD